MGALGGKKGMDFKFLPGIAGIPYPPMMMNGPHFHPPVSVTVNSIPNPNPRSSLNPFEIEQANLKNVNKELSGIAKGVGSLNRDVEMINEQIGSALDDKYNRILQIGT